MAVSSKNKPSKAQYFPLSDYRKESYCITTSRRKVGIYGERFIDLINRATKQELTGKLTGGIISLQQNDKDSSRIIKFSTKALLANVLDHNYTNAENAMRKMESTFLEWRIDGVWKSRALITDPDIDEVEHTCSFRIPVEIWETFKNEEEGVRVFRSNAAYELSSEQAYRLYKLVANQKIPLTFSIAYIKEMLKIENKYKKLSDFVSRVLEPAREILMNTVEWYFDYSFAVSKKRKLQSKPGRPAYDLIIFTAKYNVKYADIISDAYEYAHGNPVALLPDKLLSLLKTRYMFTETEILNSHIIIQAYDIMKQNDADLYNFLIDNQKIIDGSRDKNNRKAFLLGVVKQHVFKTYQVALGNFQKAELAMFQDRAGRSRGGNPTPISELLKKE